MRPPRVDASHLWRWAAVIGVGVAVALIPRPEGVSANAWQLLAIFLSTVAGLTLQPLPGGAMVLLGVTATILFGTQPIAKALAGYGDPGWWTNPPRTQAWRATAAELAADGIEV